MRPSDLDDYSQFITTFILTHELTQLFLENLNQFSSKTALMRKVLSQFFSFCMFYCFLKPRVMSHTVH